VEIRASVLIDVSEDLRPGERTMEQGRNPMPNRAADQSAPVSDLRRDRTNAFDPGIIRVDDRGREKKLVFR
jgi:hypothetical protein